MSGRQPAASPCHKSTDNLQPSNAVVAPHVCVEFSHETSASLVEIRLPVEEQGLQPRHPASMKGIRVKKL